MKGKTLFRSLFIAGLLFVATEAQAQKIEKNYREDWTYSHNRYDAQLEKSFFGGLDFSDNNRNKIEFSKEYLNLEYSGILEDDELQQLFLMDLVKKYKYTNRYTATYEVDMFGKVTIKDNQGNKIEYGTDLFGNKIYEDKKRGIKYSIGKDLMGDYNYKSGRESASLKKDIFDKWKYTDSFGNKLEIGQETWGRWITQFRDEEGVLFYLITVFFRPNDNIMYR